MYYCPDCCKFRSADRCTLCGTRLSRGPTSGDLCFLEEVDFIWSGMLEDVLRQQQIPFITRSDRSAGLSAKWGHLGETIRFYVPYENHGAARELADSLFHLPEETSFCD